MNGKKAKKLRKMARSVLVNVMKESLSDGYNEYNQARNCSTWKPALDADGLPMKDEDGKAMLTLSTTEPGTITCRWKLRILYQQMKRRVRHVRKPQFTTFEPKLTRRQRKADARSLRLKQGNSDAAAGPRRISGPSVRAGAGS